MLHIMPMYTNDPKIEVLLAYSLSHAVTSKPSAEAERSHGTPRWIGLVLIAAEGYRQKVRLP